MSETPEETPAGTPEEKPAEEQPTKSETDWKTEARKWEQRAKENSEAAKKLADLEEANKSELQKAQERIAELESRSAAAERQALVTRIAAEKGVIPEVLTGNTEEEMRAAADRVIEWASQGKRTPPPAKKLASGSASTPNDGEKGRAAAALRALRQG